jgi:hypothetical protein
MQRKIILKTFLTALIILNPLTIELDKREEENYKQQEIPFLTAVIHTVCENIEKSTTVLFGSVNEIDVDNNEETGIKGKDISVQYIILPWIEFEPDLALGLNFIINVKRIGEEIKDKDFSIYLEAESISIGFRSPKGSEIPYSTSVSLAFLYFLESGLGLKFSLVPKYEDYRNKTIILFVQHEDRLFSLEFNPSIESEVILKPKGKGWWYRFKRISYWDSTLTFFYRRIKDGEEKKTSLKVHPLPSELSFYLELTPLGKEGGKLIYESERMFDIELNLESDELGVCRYAILRNTPRKIVAEWYPSKVNGFYHLAIDSDGTKFVLQDSPKDPSVAFALENLETIDFSASWNLTNPGRLEIEKTSGVNIYLKFKMEEWTLKLDSQFTSDYLALDWNINSSGYLGIDTNWEPITTINLTIILKELLGFSTVAKVLRAENFCLSWILGEDISVVGKLDFLAIAIDVYLAGKWYHLFG